MKVAITGATGFIGRHIVQHLAGAGHEIAAAVRAETALPTQWKNSSSTRPVQLSGQAEQFKRLLEGADAVIHLAGLASTPRGKDAARALQAANVDLSAELVEAAKLAGVRRFIHLSSIRAVVGSTASNLVDDNTIPAPVEPYGRSKLDSERIVAGFATQDRFAVSLRPPLVIGADARGNWKRLQQLAASGLPLPFGGIHNRRSYLSIQTLVQALEHLAGREWPAELSGTYCLADPLALSLPEVIGALKRGMPVKSRLFSIPGLKATRFVPGMSGLAGSLFGSLVVDAQRFFETFDFQPNLPLVDAMTVSGAQYFAASR